MIGFGNTARLLTQVIQEAERRHAETLREVADALVLLAKAVETLAQSQQIPPPVEGDTPRALVDEGEVWMAFEKSRLQQMGQAITPEIHARLQERAAAMKVFNG